MSYEKDKIISLIYRIFKNEEWRWINDKDVEKIPTYEEIENHINRLEEDVLKNKINFISCGRIRVEYDKELQEFQYLLEL